MNRPLGCLSGGGLLAAAVTLTLVLVFFVAGGGAMFSPGPLNAEAGAQVLGAVSSHAQTGGKCAACHPAPWSAERMADRCLACHTRVAAELQGGQGLHAALRGQGAAFDCRTCHREHRGATAALTEIAPDAFPHAATGYRLDGHATTSTGEPFACGDCHTASIGEFTVATCTECHRQIDPAYTAAHVADFGSACLNCHDGVDRYSRTTFDHNTLAFPLDGKHAPVACGRCHVGATTLVDLQGAPSACSACHADPDFHRAAFGTQCGDCHTANGWQPATFNLQHTFPINHGEGGPSSCRTCHPQSLATYSCYGCHEHTPAEITDKHRGEVSGDITDCVRCHPTGREDEGDGRGEANRGRKGDD